MTFASHAGRAEFLRSVLAVALGAAVVLAVVLLSEALLRELRILRPQTWRLTPQAFTMVAAERAIAVFVAAVVAARVAAERPLAHGVTVGIVVAGFAWAHWTTSAAARGSFTSPLDVYPLLLGLVAPPAAWLGARLFVITAGRLPGLLFRAAQVLATVVPLAAILTAPAWLEEEDSDWEFIADVLLSDGVVRRFSGPAQIFVQNGTEADFAAVAAIVEQLNALTVKGGAYWYGPRPWTGRTDTPSILIDFVDASVVGKRTLGFAKLDGAPVVEAAYAAVLRTLRGDERVSTILHEVGHAVGFAGHASYARRFDSLMAAETEMYGYTLPPLDRKALRFLYEHLRPGDEPAAVRRAYDAHWRDTADR